MTEHEARQRLAGAGLTDEQMAQMTGFGLRRIEGCQAEDSIVNKFRAGALTLPGVRVALEQQA